MQTIYVNLKMRDVIQRTRHHTIKGAEPMKNTFREKMLRGEKPIGSFFSLGNGSAAECLGLSGLDYMIIDTEHAVYDAADVLELSRVAKLYGITPLARTQEISRAAILKLLDAGAMGLIVPSVNSLEEAELIVSYGKYAPLGERGVAPSAGTDFWMKDYAQQGLEHYFETSNRETMLIPQCETMGCLDNLEQIVALPGIDGIFVGPYDLSTAMGIPGQFYRSEFKEALRHIRGVCAAAGKPSIIFAASEAAVREGFEMGYDSVSYSIDSLVLVNAYKEALKRLRG